MTMDPTERGRLVTRQFAATAVSEGALILAVLLQHYARPLTGWTILLLGLLLAVGIAAAVYTIYRAVRLAEEPTLRGLAYLTIGMVILAPVLLWLVLQLQ